MFHVLIKKSARKQLKSLPQSMYTRIVERIKVIASSDNPEDFGIKLVGVQPKTFRLKVGSYRIIYRVDQTDNKIEIFKFGHRKDVYRR